MEKDILQNYYESFINDKNKHSCWLGFVDYVNFVLNDRKCEEFISDIETAKENLISKKEDLEKLANEEVKKLKTELEKEKKALELEELGIEIPLKNIEELNNIYDVDKLLYSDKYVEVQEAESKIRSGSKKDLWGSWDIVYGAYSTIKSQDEFDIEKYKPHITRIHNNLLRRLAGEKIKKPKELRFDLSKGILTVGDESVKIKTSGNHYHLFAIIFSDRGELFREWFFSEIGEQMDRTGSIQDDRKIYNIVNYLNSKIAKKTEIKQFFITTTHSLKINPDYNFS